MPKLKALIEKPPRWLSGSGEEAELVLSSRVRIARNLDKRPFTHGAGARVLGEIRDETKTALEDCPSLAGAVVLDMDEISESDRLLLAERRLISREMAKNFVNRCLIVQPDEQLGVMINEEDHLRIQSFEPGFSLQSAFERIGGLDNEIDSRLCYAYSEELGYLTACPTNVGTGLRVSAMVHLPGLVHNKDIGQVLDGLRNIRLTVRGIQGEGSDIVGNLFQISNSITLGLSEEDTVRNIEGHVRKVLEFEKKARSVLLKKARSLLEDKIWRAHGILKTARVVSSKEAMSLISAVRLGIGLGVITDCSLGTLNELFIMVQPMHLQRLHDKVMKVEERDRARADYIREKLNGYK
ncbi:MAG: protein arginine kinase [Candidatus Krumholzibacteria bacterium]|nr:protein arginine kinase [Candidatus Krumholzibacteria bacterium]